MGVRSLGNVATFEINSEELEQKVPGAGGGGGLDLVVIKLLRLDLSSLLLVH